MLKEAKNSADYISTFFDGKKFEIAIILGSGLGELVNYMEIWQTIPYSQIPDFPVSTVQGHKGNLILGSFGGKNVIVMQGRFHFYEGYPMSKVTFPERVMKYLGIKQLFVSNAAGGANKSYKAGDLMVITDHINLFPEHPLRGHNDEDLGPRFPSMTDAYSPRIISLADVAAKEMGLTLQHGVYVGLQGPSFETPAEYNMVRVIGGDAVGMSTVPEVIVARHMGIEVFGMSVITNSTSTDTKTSHEEVQDVGKTSSPNMTKLFEAIIRKL